MAAPSRKADTGDRLVALAIAVFGMFAWCMPNTVLALTPDCLISKVTDGWCWGCGMTHAIIALLHGDLSAAWQSNKLSLVVAPMLLGLYLQYLRLIWHNSQSRLPKNKAA
jgi:hypothetical protein